MVCVQQKKWWETVIKPFQKKKLKNPTYLVAVQELKEENHMLEGVQLRKFRCPNNIV